MGNKLDTLAIVVPCYNEEAVLEETSRRLTAVLDRVVGAGMVSPDSYVLYVNDGSGDRTWDIIAQHHSENKRIHGVCLAGNVGHQNALIAGMTVAKESADIIVTIDADLQDDVDAIDRMIEEYRKGADIVYGVRNSRQSDSWFKRTTAKFFYKTMRRLGTGTVYNHADFRLMSHRAVEQLCLFRERNLFLRGMVPLIGFKTAEVGYSRGKRFAGESKYSFGKMLHFAVDGVTSFSVMPVRIIFYLGLAFIVIAILILAYVLVAYMSGRTTPGWTSLILSVWFCSGCVLVGIGVIGEYIGKIYLEVKDRPRYCIESILGEEKDSEP